MPPSQRDEPEEPAQSLATYSRLNQVDPAQDMNDAIVPGTFGGDDVGKLAAAKLNGKWILDIMGVSDCVNIISASVLTWV